MQIIDISKDYLKLFAAKQDIEEMLINAKRIDEEMSIPDFIKFLEFGSHIYFESTEKIYPFKIINTPNQTYMFITNVDNIKYDPLFTILEKINYDFSKLTLKSNAQIALEGITYEPHFIINRNLYYFEENNLVK